LFLAKINLPRVCPKFCFGKAEYFAKQKYEFKAFFNEIQSQNLEIGIDFWQFWACALILQ